ncbi:hypothetical protein Tco_1039951 [Tanacetum coccineum]
MASSSLPWTTAEEITLCVAWCNAMYTYETTRKGFWEDVFANFKEDMGGTEEYQQLLVDEAVFKEHSEKEANAEQERAIADKELEEFLKAEQAKIELIQMKFCRHGEKADSDVENSVFKEHSEKEANAEQERAIADKELEEFLKAKQAHDELFMMEFGVKSDSEYETD